MPFDILSLLGEPGDAWCGKYILDGKYHAVEEPLWGVRSSVLSGLVASQAVALRSAEPYITLWPLHWEILAGQLARMGVAEVEFDTSEELRRAIWLLASRNHYPAHSLAHIFVWLEQAATGDAVRSAVFQRKLDKGIMEVVARPLFLLAGAKVAAVGDGYDPWRDGAVEAVADRTARSQGCDGAALTLADGRLARTTIGNIFFFLPGARVVGVGRNARPDALCRLMFEKRLFDRFKLTYEEHDAIGQTIITEAQECFVCDSALGLQPVMSIGTNKRFFNRVTPTLAEGLRRLVDF